MPEAARDLESDPLDHHRAVAPALATALLPPEGVPQDLARRTVPQDVLTVDEAVDRLLARLVVLGSVVFHLHPRLRRFVKKGERQVRHFLDHRQKPSFDLAPEDFLLPVLEGAIRKRVLLDDREPWESL